MKRFFALVAGVTVVSIILAKVDDATKAQFEAAIERSDDFLVHRVLFLDAAMKLKADFSCAATHLENNGGFVRSAETSGRYFTYCGDYDRIDLTIIDDATYTLKKQSGTERRYARKDAPAKSDDDVAKKIAELEAKVRPIPAYDFSANLEIYRQLLVLDPANEQYRSKVSHYTAMDKADEKRRLEKPALAATTPAALDCDEAISEWLTHNIAKNAIKRELKAPRTARFSNYRTSFVAANAGRCDYLVSVDVDAQNSFGALIRKKMTAAVSIDPATTLGAGAVVD